MDQHEHFEAWLRDVSAGSFEDGAAIDPRWLRWFRAIHEEHGPLAREDVDVRVRQRIEATLAAAPWTRLTVDVRSTTGRVLHVDVAGGAAGAWIDISVTLDGEHLGSMGHNYCLADPEALLAALAGDLREFVLDEAIWGGWPICPRHHTHPLEPTLVGDVASWVCPSAYELVAIVGELKVR